MICVVLTIYIRIGVICFGNKITHVKLFNRNSILINRAFNKAALEKSSNVYIIFLRDHGNRTKKLNLFGHHTN